ncbi:DUF2797 domain-containing protein [Actinomadura coerulea]|uniref:DUF2797 domain-containing protein n=1 Tax=Actinomadura coerulea TaxID=46159 RepID=UPI00341F6B46
MPVPSLNDGDYVCHGVTWAAGAPRLLLAPLPGGPLVPMPLMNRRLGYRACGTGRWCTGRYRFVNTVAVEAVACPDRARVEKGAQCAGCCGRDDFRLAHQFHQGGNAPQALIQYMAQPHWLYLATFADGTTKVGTAAEPRKRSRLDEQGALFATYLTSASDGRAVRLLEDTLTRRIKVPQTVRAATKLRALADLRDVATARTAHERHVARAAAALTEMGIDTVLDPWTPPTEGDHLRQHGTGRVLYPHDPREGDHGLTPLSCIGSQILATLDGDGDGDVYLLDLGVLKGHRITLGPFHSPRTAVQPQLF